MNLKICLSMMVCVLALVQNSRADISTGLVLKLQLDETSGAMASDSSGNGNHATLINLPIDDSQWTNGRIGGALKFNSDGSNDEVATVSDNGNLNFSSGLEFTLSAWVRASGGTQVDGGAILAKGTGAGGEQYVVDVVGGNFRFFVRNGVSPFTATVLQSTVPANGSWQHVSGVFSSAGGILKLFVNGQIVMSTNPPPSLEDTPHELSIGSRELSAVSGYNLPFTGAIDDVRIFNRALSDADMQELYLDAGIVGPSFVLQPQSVARFAGESATFSVIADGTWPLSYQWKKGLVNIEGATNSTLTLTNLVLTNAGDYSVAVTNSVGGILSTNAVLQVTVLPAGDFTTGLIAHYAFDATTGMVALDSAGTNTASLINFPGDDSQWVTGRVGGALRFNPPGDAIHDDLVQTDGNIVFNNTDNFTFAFWVKMTDNEAGANPRFISPTVTHWMLWSKTAGGVGLFTSRPSPIPQLLVWKHFVMTYNRPSSNYVLFVNGTKVVTNATNYVKASPGSARWVIGHAENVLGHGEFIRADFDDVRIYNRILADADVKGLYDSAGIFPLQVTKQPVGASKVERDNVTFSVSADGTLPFTYQWQHNTTNILGATNSTLILTDLALSSAGDYRVVLNNGGQIINSSNAVLQVAPLPPPDLTTSLIAHWKFDDASGTVAADSSGNGASATLFNFPEDNSQWTTGKVGGALYFNRNGDSNDLVGVDAPLPLQDGDLFTFTFWLKRDPGATGVNPRIITPLGAEHWVLWNPNRGLGFHTTVPSLQPNSNTWSHFVVSYNRPAGIYTLYVNGVRVVTEAGIYTRANPMTLSSLWIIGHSESASSHSDPWRGYMDDLRVYNRLLTVSDVELLYFTDATEGPRLTSQRNGNSISISWSAVAPGGYVLQSSGTLGAGEIWGDVLDTPAIAAGRKTVTLNSQTGTKFYRLRKP